MYYTRMHYTKIFVDILNIPNYYPMPVYNFPLSENKNNQIKFVVEV